MTDDGPSLEELIAAKQDAPGLSWHLLYARMLHYGSGGPVISLTAEEGMRALNNQCEEALSRLNRRIAELQGLRRKGRKRRRWTALQPFAIGIA